MAGAVLAVSLEGQKQLTRLMAKLDPKRDGVQWQRRGLVRAALLVQKTAAKDKIKRGGKGKPVAGILTSRTGTLRRSISVDRALLPGAVEVGTGLKYGAVHETGGIFGIRSHTVSEHTRRMAFGRKTKPFTVPSHFRMGHDAKFPKRAFLVPALDEESPKFPDIFVEEINKVLGSG